MSGSVPAQKYPKLPEDIENEKDIVEELKKLTPLPIKLKGFAVNHYTLQLKEIGDQEEVEIEALNVQTQKNFQQNLQSINDLINGTRAPTEQELKELESYLTDEERTRKDELLAGLKPLPDYWLTAFKNDPVIKSHINDNDEKALKHLTRVDYKLSDSTETPHNFSVTFHFSPNDYFTNDVLTTNFHMKEARDVTKTDGTEIAWKDGQNFTKKKVEKKQKNKKTGQTRTVTKEEDVPSLFLLFKSIVAPEEDKELEEEEEELQNQILDQVDIGYSLVEELVPFSLEYYLGVKKDFMGEGDDEDFEDDDEEDDEEEEEEAPKGKGKGKGNKPTPGAGGAGAAGGAAGKQECKQQ